VPNECIGGLADALFPASLRKVVFPVQRHECTFRALGASSGSYPSREASSAFSSPMGARPIHFLAFVRCRYPGIKTFLASLVALVMLSSRAYAEPNSPSFLPSAPVAVAVKTPVFGAVDGSLAGSVVVARALDWTSTEECLRHPWCTETELPSALVKNKAGFAAFEAGVSGLSILAQYEMTRRGHRRWARLGQSIDVGSIGYTVMHNYRIDLVPPGSRVEAGLGGAVRRR
jgi:hypothetical protein